MTREQAIAELKELRKSGDQETAYWKADKILCKLLAALGYNDVTEEYSKLDKWYA